MSTKPKSPVKITNSFVARSELPAQGQIIYRDAVLKGFAIRVTRGGAKTFILEKRIFKKVRRMKIGRFPEITAEQARKEAQKMLGTIACGRDPISERRVAEVKGTLLSSIYCEFIKLRPLKANTVKDYDRAMSHAFADWSRIPVETISEEMILRRYAELSERGKTSASRHMRFLRSLISFAQCRFADAMGNPILTNNPVLVLSKLKVWHRANRRRTYIRESELTDWFNAVIILSKDVENRFATTAMDYLKFLLLTGLRREEAARLTWNRIDLENKTFTITDTKNGNDHILPLSDYLVDLLIKRNGQAINEYVFAGNGRSGHLVNVYKHIESVTKISGVKFCLHDLRRTFATAADTLDLPDRIVKRLLNHSVPADVTSGYIVSGVQRLRQPMQRITDYLLSHGGIRSSVVLFPTTHSSVENKTSVEA